MSVIGQVAWVAEVANHHIYDANYCIWMQHNCNFVKTTHFKLLCNSIITIAIIVATLAWGSRLRQGLAKVQAKSEAQESHFMLPKV